MTSNSQTLRTFAESASTQMVTEVVPGTVYHVLGYGHSNATFIVAESSVILIDTLDSDARGARLGDLIREHTTKPIRTIIYTHGHPDHRGGAGSLLDDNPEIIAFAPVNPALGRSHLLSDVLTTRGARQFGYHLTDEQVITQGLGPREGHTHGENYAFVPPTTLYSEARVERSIDGIDIGLVAAPGETDDTIFVWLPQFKVLCCGDNYYECWPNLSAIRGHSYRDVDAWVKSLEAMIAMNAEALLPGHFWPIIWKTAVRERLSSYREALDYVLNETLRLMNTGLDPRQIVDQLQLPEHLRNLDFLREFYGTIEWSIYGIFSGYLGWFNGNPANLHPLPPVVRSTKTIAAMGGEIRVLQLIEDALDTGDFQWAMELCDHLLSAGDNREIAGRHKATALLVAAEHETSACGRNYYVSCAMELTKSAAG